MYMDDICEHACLHAYAPGAQSHSVSSQGTQDHLHELQGVVICGVCGVRLRCADLLRTRRVHDLRTDGMARDKMTEVCYMR